MINKDLCKLVGTLHDSPIETGISEKESLNGKAAFIQKVVDAAPTKPTWAEYKELVMKVLGD